MSATSKTTPSSGANVSSGENDRCEVVFFGTGPVAAESLHLLTDYFAIEAVVTKPKPPHHKGDFPVLDVATMHNIPVIPVTTAVEVSGAVQKAAFRSRVAILIDFGIIVRQDTIDSFALGIINSHFSLLPQWRGADPITFSLLSGQKQTGVCLMKLVEQLDAGDVIAFGLYDLDGSETNASLTHDLVKLSAGLLRDTLPRYMENQGGLPQLTIADAVPKVDYPRKISYSQKLTKQDGVIDFSKPAEQLEREVRAYLGWPGSRTVIAGKDVVIIKSHVGYEPKDASRALGTVFARNKELCLQTSDGVLVVDELKPAGKPAMPASAFLAGYGTKL